MIVKSIFSECDTYYLRVTKMCQMQICGYDPRRKSLEIIISSNEAARDGKRGNHKTCKELILDYIAEEWPGHKTFQKMFNDGTGIGSALA